MKKENIRKYLIFGIILIAIVVVVVIGITSSHPSKRETQNQNNGVETQIEDRMPEDASERENPTTVEEPQGREN